MCWWVWGLWSFRISFLNICLVLKFYVWILNCTDPTDALKVSFRKTPDYEPGSAAFSRVRRTPRSVSQRQGHQDVGHASHLPSLPTAGPRSPPSGWGVSSGRVSPTEAAFFDLDPRPDDCLWWERVNGAQSCAGHSAVLPGTSSSPGTWGGCILAGGECAPPSKIRPKAPAQLGLASHL